MPFPINVSDRVAGAEFTLKAGDRADFVLESEANQEVMAENFIQYVTECLCRTIN